MKPVSFSITLMFNVLIASLLRWFKNLYAVDYDSCMPYSVWYTFSQNLFLMLFFYIFNYTFPAVLSLCFWYPGLYVLKICLLFIFNYFFYFLVLYSHFSLFLILVLWSSTFLAALSNTYWMFLHSVLMFSSCTKDSKWLLYNLFLNKTPDWVLFQ